MRLTSQIFAIWTLGSLVSGITGASAETFSLDPQSHDSVVGEVRSVIAEHDDTLLDIGRRFDLGYDAIVKANKSINRWLPGQGTEISIPSMYILPDAGREGIVLNIAELRLYYYPKNCSSSKSKIKSETDPTVMIFPVSIGRMDWETPLGRTTVVRKQENPSWTPPKTIRAEHAEEGEVLPEIIPGGRDDNPLGHYALYLGVKGYLIHGTDDRKSFGIGMNVTHGCVRMYPEDIATLYSVVKVGTPVYIVNQPVKVGWKEGKVYLEVNRPAEDLGEEQLTHDSVDRAVDDQVDGRVNDAAQAQGLLPEEVLAKVTQFADNKVEIDRERVTQISESGQGIPMPVGNALSHSPPTNE